MVLVDDVGSYPLTGVSRGEFSKAYNQARELYANGEDMRKDTFVLENFYMPVAESFASKLASGIDVVTYPQHYDMHKQFLEPIEKHQTEPFVVDSKYAILPELYVVSEEAKRHYEETGNKVKLKVCVTGPIDLYTRTDFGYHVYPEVLMNLAKSVNDFLRNSMLKERHISTEVVSLDEPSLGYADLLNVEKNDLIEAIDRSVRNIDATVQMHLHGLGASNIPLSATGVDVITVESAGSPEQLNLVSKTDLEVHDKYLRVGVSRTNIDTIIAEWLEKGIQPTDEQLIDSASIIRSRYETAREIFGDRLAFAGPDCGLVSWPSQEIAQLLLKRTVEAIKT